MEMGDGVGRYVYTYIYSYGMDWIEWDGMDGIRWMGWGKTWEVSYVYMYLLFHFFLPFSGMRGGEDGEKKGRWRGERARGIDISLVSSE